MTNPSDALRVVVGLAENATPGEWMLATSCSWRRILTTEHRPVIVPTTQRADGHPDLDCGQDYVNAETAIAAVNFIREHGAALAQALEDSHRIDALEACVARDGGIRIHSGNYHGDFGGLVTDSRRTLRQALDVLVPAIAAQQKEAANAR